MHQLKTFETRFEFAKHKNNSTKNNLVQSSVVKTCNIFNAD